MTDMSWIQDLQAVVPAERISTAEDDLLRHSYDSWPMATKWRQQDKAEHKPDVVVRPLSTDEVSQVIGWAGRRKIPVTPWGGGSSVTGAPLVMHGGISLDMSGMNQTLWLDDANLMVKVQAGIVGQALESELNKQELTLNHSPQSPDRSTVGGWVATRASGQFSSRWGGIDDLTLALTAVLPTGEVVETRLAPRAALGPDVRQLFIGAEGTLGVVTEVTLKVFPMAQRRLLETVAFPDVEAGLAAMRQMMRCGLRPFLLRLYDEDEARQSIRHRRVTGCSMFLGFEGQPAVAQAEYRESLAMCRAEGGQTLGPDPVATWLERRFDLSAIEDVLAEPGGVAETIEVAHFWEGIGPTYRALKAALAPVADQVLGHFSHPYLQGASLYLIVLGEVGSAGEAEERLARIWEVAMTTCLEQGAAISHHSGVGLARLPYMRQDVGSGMVVLERIKSALDPAGIMNPGKLGL